jgi:hypothetical protein
MEASGIEEKGRDGESRPGNVLARHLPLRGVEDVVRLIADELTA